MDAERVAAILAATAHLPAPFLVYDLAALDADARAFPASGRFRPHFALKACYVPEVLRRLAAVGVGAEVASELELRMALDAGWAPSDIVFHGHRRSPEALAQVLEGGGVVFLDSDVDLPSLTDAGVPGGSVGVRIATPAMGARDGYAAPDSKLGLELNLDATRRLLTRIHDDRSIAAVHCHLGAGAASVADAARTLSELLEAVETEPALQEVAVFDVGGGFPAAETTADWWHDASAALWEDLLDDAGRSQARAIAEPGRALVSRAGVFVAEVLGIRRGSCVDHVLIERGTNVLVPLPTSDYRVLHPGSEPHGREHRLADAIPNPANVIGSWRAATPPPVGSRIAVGYAGAYTQVLSHWWIDEPCPVAVVDQQEVSWAISPTRVTAIRKALYRT